MKIPLSWLAEFVDLPADLDALIASMDDLGLVVEGVERIGEGLEDVIVARVNTITPIEGADRIRLISVDAGNGPLDIVCGAMNFAVGNHVPLAPVGAVLPGNFVIAERRMKGVISNGMLCSARELRLSEDHEGLMLLDALITPVIGEKLTSALGIVPDVVLDVSIEGNRPDAWSIVGIARDLAARFGQVLRLPAAALPDDGAPTSSLATATIAAPDLCGRLTLSVLTDVVVGPSPQHLAQRLTMAGMRPISNVVDASNLVMLELGQPTHPYDASLVAGSSIGVRRARSGESLQTLDDVTRPLAQPGRGLGDSGDDCVIVDGDDQVIGLAGIMGGASSEISAATTTVLLEAAFFDPMTIARSSKRHGLRSEASNRFERGVDPELALFAAARFVELLRQSSPTLHWMSDPLDVRGETPSVPSVTLRPGDVQRSLGVTIDESEVRRLLTSLDFTVTGESTLIVTPPTRRLDVRDGAAGRADVIEEIARLYSYSRLPRHTPTWPQPGGLSDRQKMRRRLRDVLVDLGVNEAWTPTLGSDEDFALLHPNESRVRVTNPLASEESVLRRSMILGLVRAWARNAERGLGDVVLGEIGVVFTHPDDATTARVVRGGNGGSVKLTLPSENERATIILGRSGDDATSAVAFWNAVASRLDLHDVVVRSTSEVAAGLHPTRAASLELSTGEVLGWVGEVDPALLGQLSTIAARRLGVLDLDLDVVIKTALERQANQYVAVPSRFPSAGLDLALVTPQTVHAADVAQALRAASEFVQDVVLFDVYQGPGLPQGTRSLAYALRMGADDRTLSERELGDLRAQLIAAANALGAILRA